MGPLTLWIFFFALVAHAYSQALHEYCPWETFKASCKSDEVIIMETARYGRMHLGRCVKNDLGYVGCFTDVLDLLDSRCSGKNQCEFQTPDRELSKLQPCLEDLTSYLEASYRCVKVVNPHATKCTTKARIPVKAKEGYIASSVSEATSCGSELAPWKIEAEKGQIIELHLLDFSVSRNAHGASPIGHEGKCPVYANIKEDGVRVGQVLCGGKGKERHVYTTVGSSVDITLPHRTHGKPEKRFLIYFVVKGCPEPKLSTVYWYKRKYNEALVGCKSGGDTWTMKCVANKWTGNIGNCSSEASVANNQKSLWSLPISSRATVAIIIIVSLLIGGVILMFGIIFTRRQKDNEYGDRKSVRHIGEMPYSQPTKLKAMQCMTHTDMSMDADNHVSSFCEEKEYTHTWDTYPTHLAGMEVGQYGGTVLVTNPGLCSLHHHQGCNNIYDTALGSRSSKPTRTTVRFENVKNLTDVTVNNDVYFDIEGNNAVNTVNELREGSVPAITNGEATTTDSLINANYNMK